MCLVAADGYGMGGGTQTYQGQQQGGGRVGRMGGSSAQLVEEENEQMAAQLSDKVKALKSVSVHQGFSNTSRINLARFIKLWWAEL